MGTSSLIKYVLMMQLNEAGVVEGVRGLGS